MTCGSGDPDGAALASVIRVPPFAPAAEPALDVDDADELPPPLELVDFDEPPQAATNMPAAATTVAKITDRFTAPSSCGPRPMGLAATLPRG